MRRSDEAAFERGLRGRATSTMGPERRLGGSLLRQLRDRLPGKARGVHLQWRQRQAVAKGRPQEGICAACALRPGDPQALQGTAWRPLHGLERASSPEEARREHRDLVAAGQRHRSSRHPPHPAHAERRDGAGNVQALRSHLLAGADASWPTNRRSLRSGGSASNGSASRTESHTPTPASPTTTSSSA